MRQTVTNIIVFLLIFLFTYTAISKLSERNHFVSVLKTIPFIGTGAGVVAILLPLAELFIVLLLIFERTRLKGLYASLIILGVFTIYLCYMILFMPHLPCSCGGVISKMGWRWHVVFNVGFVVMTVVEIRNERKACLSARAVEG
jgi:hypothetical protein